ncbi:hypothetical protein FSP39_011971 [Pinctada imbricata]|uniref:C2H2-type domain-containing protein n=1 Tax=Pinctada imbricata TaxID=66713 RepID=A0AA88YEE9_PINIB|nr:hypothetical protein FSP39_011971 [Pinctada imbricata]
MSLLKQKSSQLDSCIDRIYNCSKCGTGFKSKKSKMRHEKYTCGDLRSFECEVCGKFYSRADSKTRHMFRIHGIKPGFSGQSSLSDANYSLDDSHLESLENEMHQNDSMEGFQNGVENDSE